VLTRLGAPTPAALVVVVGNAGWVLLSVATVAADLAAADDARRRLRARSVRRGGALFAVMQLAGVRARS